METVKKIKNMRKLLKWWYFHVMNPVISKGEGGGFRWKFRKMWLEISTLSENFKARWTASDHPYGYLYYGDGEQVQGFAERIYLISNLLTTDVAFAKDIDKALDKYAKRVEKGAKVEENETEEMAAIEHEKQVQQYVEAPKKEKKKMEKAVDKKFKKVVKNEGKN